MQASDITLTNLDVRAFIYGRPGTAKTWSAASFCSKDKQDCYIFDFDAGTLTLRNFRNVTGKNPLFDTYAREVGSWERMAVKLEALKKDSSIRTIVFDSLTTLAEVKIEEVLRKNSKPRMTLEMWGVFIGEIELFFGNLSTFKGKNIVMTAHEFNDKDENTGEIMTQPLIYGKNLPSKIPLWFDEVYHTEVVQKGVEFLYIWRTRATARYTGKTRLGFLPTECPADFEFVRKLVEAEQAKEVKLNAGVTAQAKA